MPRNYGQDSTSKAQAQNSKQMCRAEICDRQWETTGRQSAAFTVIRTVSSGPSARSALTEWVYRYHTRVSSIPVYVKQALLCAHTCNALDFVLAFNFKNTQPTSNICAQSYVHLYANPNDNVQRTCHCCKWFVNKGPVDRNNNGNFYGCPSS